MLKPLEEEVDIECPGRSGLEELDIKLQDVLNLRCPLTAEGMMFSSSLIEFQTQERTFGHHQNTDNI